MTSLNHIASNDLITQLGELAIGSRLKRACDRIMKDGTAVYRLYGIDFDPYNFTVFYALSQGEKMSVTELAQVLQVSHPSIIKVAKTLEKQGLIVSSRDQKDARKRLLSLSKQGQDLLPHIKEAWADIAISLHQMISHQNHQLLNALSAFEEAMEEEDLLERVRKNRSQRLLQAVEILDYDPQFANYFKQLNYDWIEKYFTIEDIDVQVLDRHQEEILDKGGQILFARLDGQIVGTCALKKDSPDRYELAKMAVEETFRGRQVGKKLGLASIERAKTLGAKTVYLLSNKRLQPAIQLYKRLGFREVHFLAETSAYERSDIMMELQLK
ncbi:MAG: bifunctional helix-turn-helix transcriptional regulator/GNAT family N-acetyltransferase [Bacteroidota bacterium]